MDEARSAMGELHISEIEAQTRQRQRAAHQQEQPTTEYVSYQEDSEETGKEGNDGALREHSASVGQESHTRSFVKGLTWRVIATSTTTIIAYIITGHVDSALQIGFFEFFAKLAIYYAHERIWTRIRL